MRTYSLYLKDISESIKKILEYTKEIDYEEFTEKIDQILLQSNSGIF